MNGKLSLMIGPAGAGGSSVAAAAIGSSIAAGTSSDGLSVILTEVVVLTLVGAVNADVETTVEATRITDVDSFIFKKVFLLRV